MLHKIIIENYKSFGTKSEISLYPNIKRAQYVEHIHEKDLLFPVLKHCLVVGGNASGKTNMVMAMKFLKDFCCKQQQGEQQEDWLKHWYYNNRFKMPIAEDAAPIHFLVEFSFAGKYYTYSCAFDGEGIKIEALYRTPGLRLRPVVVFVRARNKVEFHKDIYVPEDDLRRLYQQMKLYPESSVLAMNANLGFVENEDIVNAQRWFLEKLEISHGDYSLPWLMDLYCNTPRSLGFTNTILKKMGIGCTVAFSEHKPSEWLKCNVKYLDRTVLNLFEGGEISPAVYNYNDKDFIIRTVGRRKVVRQLEFVHTGVNGYEVRTKADEESAGTIHLLTLIAILYQTIYQGKTFVADGLDVNINGATFRDLMKLYCEAHGNGQLIYTANSLMSMNQQEIVRVDEVNLLEKKDGITNVITLDRFSKFKLKPLLSLMRNFLDGRLGGRPGEVSAEDIAEI